MEFHEIDRVEMPVPARAPNRRHTLVGLLGVAALVAMTLGPSAVVAASPSPTPPGTGTINAAAGPTAAFRADEAAGIVDIAGESGAVGSPFDAEKLNAAFARYAACMREHGIDMPDPVTIQNSGGLDASAPTAGVTTVTGTSQADSVPPGSDAFIAADKACAPILEDAGIGGASTSTLALPATGSVGSVEGVGTFGTVVVGGSGDLAQLVASMKAYATCMRTHDIDMPDPVVDEKTGTVTSTFGVDPATAAFSEADAACAVGPWAGYGITPLAPNGQ